MPSSSGQSPENKQFKHDQSVSNGFEQYSSKAGHLSIPMDSCAFASLLPCQRRDNPCEDPRGQSPLSADAVVPGVGCFALGLSTTTQGAGMVTPPMAHLNKGNSCGASTSVVGVHALSSTVSSPTAELVAILTQSYIDRQMATPPRQDTAGTLDAPGQSTLDAPRAAFTPIPPESCPVSPLSVPGTILDTGDFTSGAVTATNSIMAGATNESHPSWYLGRTSSLLAPPALPQNPNYFVCPPHIQLNSSTTTTTTTATTTTAATTATHIFAGSASGVISHSLNATTTSQLVPIGAHAIYGSGSAGWSRDEEPDLPNLTRFREGARSGSGNRLSAQPPTGRGTASYQFEKDPLTAVDHCSVPPSMIEVKPYHHTYASVNEHSLLPSLLEVSVNTSVSGAYASKRPSGLGDDEGRSPSPIPLPETVMSQQVNSSFLSSDQATPSTAPLPDTNKFLPNKTKYEATPAAVFSEAQPSPLVVMVPTHQQLHEDTSRGGSAIDTALPFLSSLPLFNNSAMKARPPRILPLSADAIVGPTLLSACLAGEPYLENTPTARPKNLPPTSPPRVGASSGPLDYQPTVADLDEPYLFHGYGPLDLELLAGTNHANSQRPYPISTSSIAALGGSSNYSQRRVSQMNTKRAIRAGGLPTTPSSEVGTDISVLHDSASNHSFNQNRTSPTTTSGTTHSSQGGFIPTAYLHQLPLGASEPLPLPRDAPFSYAHIAIATMRSSQLPHVPPPTILASQPIGLHYGNHGKPLSTIGGHTAYTNARSSSEWEMYGHASPNLVGSTTPSSGTTAVRDYHDDEVVSVTMGHRGSGSSRLVHQSSPTTPSLSRRGIAFHTPLPPMGPVQWSSGKPFSEHDVTRSPNRRPSVMLKNTDARPPQSARRRSSPIDPEWEGQSFSSNPADPYRRPIVYYRVTPHNQGRETPSNAFFSKTPSGSHSALLVGFGGGSFASPPTLSTPFRRISQASSVNDGKPYGQNNNYSTSPASKGNKASPQFTYSAYTSGRNVMPSPIAMPALGASPPVGMHTAPPRGHTVPIARLLPSASCHWGPNSYSEGSYPSSRRRSSGDVLASMAASTAQNEAMPLNKVFYTGYNTQSARGPGPSFLSVDSLVGNQNTLSLMEGGGGGLTSSLSGAPEAAGTSSSRASMLYHPHRLSGSELTAASSRVEAVAEIPYVEEVQPLSPMLSRRQPSNDAIASEENSNGVPSTMVVVSDASASQSPNCHFKSARRLPLRVSDTEFGEEKRNFNGAGAGGRYSDRAERQAAPPVAMTSVNTSMQSNDDVPTTSTPSDQRLATAMAYIEALEKRVKAMESKQMDNGTGHSLFNAMSSWVTQRLRPRVKSATMSSKASPSLPDTNLVAKPPPACVTMTPVLLSPWSIASQGPLQLARNTSFETAANSTLTISCLLPPTHTSPTHRNTAMVTAKSSLTDSIAASRDNTQLPLPLPSALSRSMSVLSELTSASDPNGSAMIVSVNTLAAPNSSASDEGPGGGGISVTMPPTSRIRPRIGSLVRQAEGCRQPSSNLAGVLLRLLGILVQWAVAAKRRVRVLLEEERSGYAPRLVR